MSNVHGSKWIRPEKRRAIYVRDDVRCVYCGAHRAKLTLDHLVPRELGGDNDATNLVTACVSCNSSRRDLSLRGWFKVLRTRHVDTDKLGPRIRRLVRKALVLE